MLVWYVASYDYGLLAIFDSREKAEVYKKQVTEGPNALYSDWDLSIIISVVQ